VAAEGSVSESGSVIINRNFAETIAPGGNALGRRFRYLRTTDSEWPHGPEADRWYEVVGVVGNLPVTTDARVAYHAAAPGQIRPAHLQLHLRGDPAGFAERLRNVVARVDPTLHVDEVRTLAQVYREHRFGDNLGAITIGAITGSLLLLSAAGLYALMAFTVAQRRREIGIRSALGAPPGQLVAAVFRRAFMQIGAGAAAGILAAYIVERYVPIEQIGGLPIPGVLPGAAAFMLFVFFRYERFDRGAPGLLAFCGVAGAIQLAAAVWSAAAIATLAARLVRARVLRRGGNSAPAPIFRTIGSDAGQATAGAFTIAAAVTGD